MLEVLLALKFMFSSNIWNRLLFTPQIRQFGKSDFSALIVVREKQDLLCLQTVFTNLWICHIDWEIYSVQTTLALPVDFPRVPGLSSHRSHSSSRTMWENIWEEKKRLFPNMCVCSCAWEVVFFLWVRRSVVVCCCPTAAGMWVCVEVCMETFVCLCVLDMW